MNSNIIEVHALPTDMRPTPPPPPAFTSSPSLSPFTPSNSTSVSEFNSTPQAQQPTLRRTLNPVLPSKRVAQNTDEPVIQIAEDEADQSSLYLPQEIRDIVNQRRRRERAWQVRLSICTSVICNIESTLALYKEDVEKEEASLIRNYLQLAITRLAAADNIPKPPPIPHQTKPSKVKDHVQRKESTIKKVSFIAPTLPTSHKMSQIHQDMPEGTYVSNDPQQNSWVTVARNGHKKSRTTVSTQNPSKSSMISSSLPARPPTRSRNTSNVVKNIQNKTDNRLFVRISAEHEWRKLSPAGIREVIVKRLIVSPASIGLIKPVHSGFALTPSNTEAREKLLKASGGLFLSGAKLEPATQWQPVLLPTVPTSINTLQGRVEVTKSMLIDEIERVTSVRPEAVKFYGNQKPDAPHRTWLALFTKAPRPGFRIFDESGISYIFKKQKSIDFCKRCNGHHSSKFCSRAPSCGNCGSTMHTQDTCMAATRCRNCGGPHRSDSRKCLARPTRNSAPTKEQLKIYRQAGDREFQAAARVRAAEEKASEMEAIKQNMRGTGVTEATSEGDEAVVEIILESPEPDEVRVNIPGNVQQESASIAADSTMDL